MAVQQLPEKESKMEAKERAAAWREVCGVLEQVEPCSPSHIFSAQQHHEAAAQVEVLSKTPAATKQRREALQSFCAAWLGRHGELHLLQPAEAWHRRSFRNRRGMVEHNVSARYLWAVGKVLGSGKPDPKAADESLAC